MDTPEQIIKDYKAVFAEANPDAEMQPLTYERGWYVFRNRHHGGTSSRHRRDGLEQLKAELQRRIRQRVAG